MKIKEIRYVSPMEENNPEDDNIDVHVELEDGRIYSLVVSTPNNIYWCMENEGIDYSFGFPPPVFVRLITPDNIERALHILFSERTELWSLYGVLQSDEL